MTKIRSGKKLQRKIFVIIEEIIPYKIMKDYSILEFLKSLLKKWKQSRKNPSTIIFHATVLPPRKIFPQPVHYFNG